MITQHDAVLTLQILSSLLVFHYGNALADNTPKAFLWMLLTLVAIWWR